MTILPREWYDDDYLYQMVDWLGEKYKGKCKRKKNPVHLFPLDFWFLRTRSWISHIPYWYVE